MDLSHHVPELVLISVLICVFVYSLLTKAISKTILTLPIIFMAIGYLCAVPLEMAAEPETLAKGTRLLAEITLVLVLFADASHVRFVSLRKYVNIPARMLIIGLPLTIGMGMLVAYMINPQSGLAMALLTAAVLTPTDAALGLAVVSNKDVPVHLRETINVESGLNDGLGLPFVLLGAILVSSMMVGADTDGFATASVLQVVLGPLVGIAIGWFAAKLMGMAQDNDLIDEAAGGVAFMTVAFVAFIASEVIGGNGFIAVFIAGMVFGNAYRHKIDFIKEFMEGIGQLLTMFTFFIFGAVLLRSGLEHMNIKAVFLALLFLTVVRMLPIFLSLIGTGLPLREKLFLGWFGPRGIASILFTLIIIDEFDFPGENELLACVSMTVFLSIILHGISAVPLSKWIAQAARSNG